MSAIVKSSHISFDVDVATKHAALERFSKEAATLGIAESDEAALSAFEERELEGATGLVNGFAIPHAKSAKITRASVLVHRYRAPIADWESLDGNPVDIAIALLIPEGEAGSTHIQLLSKLAVCLMREDFREAVRSASSTDDLCTYMREQLAA